MSCYGLVTWADVVGGHFRPSSHTLYFVKIEYIFIINTVQISGLFS